MDVKFLVQNPHNVPVSKQVSVDGQTVNAALDGFEVHLLAQDNLSGTFVLRAFGQNAAAARALFKKDATVTATFA